MASTPDIRRSKFEQVFSHYDLLHVFARHRGSVDPESIATETLAIAWRRIDEIDAHDCRGWLVATARNLVIAEYRKSKTVPVDPGTIEDTLHSVPDFEVDSLSPRIDTALSSLEPIDREALLLIAWDELTPKEAGASLGITSTAFRVRLHRARKRFAALINESGAAASRTTQLSKDEA